MAYATVDDVIALFRPLTVDEIDRARELIPVVVASLKTKAYAVGKDLDELAKDESYALVLKSVIVDIVARCLMTSTNSEPMTQFSESALGYTYSGSFLVPGGGLFIKRDELSKLGLRKQRYGVIEFYGNQDKGNKGRFGKED